MPFAAGLRQSLYVRDCQLASEFTRGETLQDVLEKHLLAVEEMAESELITSILLLSPCGRRLSHGAGPSLPEAYREAIDGSEIGPSAGSCGTAAHFGRPVYVTDIASDPLWADYRDHALEAIDMIAGHVAQAIMKAREEWPPQRQAPRLRLVSDNPPADPFTRLA